MKKTAVYICRCGGNISEKIDMLGDNQPVVLTPDMSFEREGLEGYFTLKAEGDIDRLIQWLETHKVTIKNLLKRDF